MDADEFRDYILGFIFYKYLSEKIHFTVNKILHDSGEDTDYSVVDENVFLRGNISSNSSQKISAPMFFPTIVFRNCNKIFPESVKYFK